MLHKVVLAILAALAMLTIGGPIPPTTSPTLSNVLFFGDSITQGQHTDDFGFDFTWQVILGLRAKSPTNAQQYLMDGVGGVTTGDFLAHLQALKLHPSQAQLIVLELGTNDYLQAVPLATMQQDLAALLAYLVADNPQARLVALNVWSNPATPNSAGIPVSQYDSVISQVAATWSGSRGSAMVDISTMFLTPDYHWPPGSPDTFHPNDAGHVAIAQAVVAAA